MSSRFHFHINNKFQSCWRLAVARDGHRGRDVEIFHMGGNFTEVGLFDGVDAWVSPASIRPLGIDCVRLLADIASGKTSLAPVGTFPGSWRDSDGNLMTAEQMTAASRRPRRRLPDAQMELPLVRRERRGVEQPAEARTRRRHV